MPEESPSVSKVGLFGGSFNPPHLAHLLIAELVREQFELERIVWIPNYQSPLKQDVGVASAHHRVAMTRLAIENNPFFEVSVVEVDREEISYTVETIRALQEMHPNVDFSLIIGSDSLESFGAWRQPDEILDRVRVIVFRRPGAESALPPRGYQERVAFADAPLLEISGTAIRERIHAGRSVRYWLPEAVRNYISKQGLYDTPHV